MPRHYTPQEKSAALIRLAENRGNVLATALQLGISERTLRYWQRKYLLENPVLPNLPPSTPSAIRQLEELPPFENDFEAVSYLRKQMLDDLLNTARQMPLDLAAATPYQRMIMLPQLVDRLMKLDQHLKPYKRQEPVTIRVLGSEGQEPDGDEDEGLKFFLLVEDNSLGPFTADELKKEIEARRTADFAPVVGVEFWRYISNEDDYLREWQGTFVPTITEYSPIEEKPL